MAGQADHAIDFGAVLAPVCAQSLLGKIRTPGAIRIAHLGAHVTTQHHLEIQALVGNDLQHQFRVTAAVVQAQVLPVRLQDAQVFQHLGVVRILPAHR